MTASPSRHHWTDPAGQAEPAAALPPAPPPHLAVCCHRRLRGPFTGGGTLLRRIVPELLDVDADSVAARALEINALAPELTPLVPTPPQTLTHLATAKERTRFYPATRALRIAHGTAELLLDWARATRPGGVVIAFHDLDDADPTDRDLVAVLLRRADPAVLTVVADTTGNADDLLGRAVAAHAARAARPPYTHAPHPPGTDLAQLYIDSDGTSHDPALHAAYTQLPPPERARRHTARAQALAARGEPTLRLGAIAHHHEHGTDPTGAGLRALTEALTGCFNLGFYEATVDLALRGRRLATGAEHTETRRNLTHKAGACLCYLGRGHEAMPFFEEMRRGSTDPDVHMGTSYLLAMLYTRFLPLEDHDEDVALAWVNTAIAFADQHPDPQRRVLVRAFMRNARALVELHRGDKDASLALVEEAIAITDADYGPDEQLLHRSVLLYNRAQVHGARGDHTASLRDYDEVIGRDPDYGDYYFERAAQHRALGRPARALADYAEAIRLTPPFYEAHFNRADLLRECGDDEGALRDLDYALDIEPDHVDSLVHRADVHLARGDTERARRDIDHGLTLAPDHPQLLSAQGALLADTGDAEAAYVSYSAALKQDPDYAAAWANRAVLAHATGRPEQAVADLDQAIRLTGGDPALHANRAVALHELGHHVRALADLDIAVAALGADDPDLLYRRGTCRHALHDIEGALADWRAHLAAFGPGETSPHAADIRLRTQGLTAGAATGEAGA